MRFFATFSRGVRLIALPLLVTMACSRDAEPPTASPDVASAMPKAHKLAVQTLSKRTVTTGLSSLASSLPQPALKAAQLAQFSNSLDLIAKRSQRGGKAVEFRRLLLKAMAAPTHEEYRRIMRPFHERNQTHRQANSAETPVGTATLTTEPDRRSHGPAADVEEPAEQCTTEMFGETYVGECADEAEVGEFHAELDALEAELSADNAERITLCESKFPEDPVQCSAPTEEDASIYSAAAWSGQELLGGSTLLELDGAVEARSCNGASTGQSGALLPQSDDCITEGVVATGAFVLWASETAAFKGLGRKLARYAFSSAQTRLLVGGFLVGYAIGSAIECVMAT